MKANGFTLVEMLVALLIFGMIAAAGVSLLSFSVRAQEMSDRALRDIAEVRRLGALLAADLAQAAPRSYRDTKGDVHPPFTGAATSGPVALALVRRGWENHDGSPRPTLQRVEYRLAAGRLERVHYPFVDGADAAAPVALVEGVSTVALRYRDGGGAWHERWAPQDPSALPVAVELTLGRASGGTISQLFLVGAGA